VSYRDQDGHAVTLIAATPRCAHFLYCQETPPPTFPNRELQKKPKILVGKSQANGRGDGLLLLTWKKARTGLRLVAGGSVDFTFLPGAGLVVGV
jgi:hypothetical protein